MSDPRRPFPLALYLALALMFGPLVLLVLSWIAVTLTTYVHGPDASRVRESGMGWLTIVLGAGAVCLFCEWLVLPMVIAGDRARPAYTPLVAFAVGLVLSIPAYFLLRSFL